MKAGAKTAKVATAKAATAKAATARKAAAARKKAAPPKREARRATPPRAASPRHVGDVMTREPVCATAGDSLRDVARVLDEYEISGVPVIDDQDRLIGVLSRTDLIRRL